MKPFAPVVLLLALLSCKNKVPETETPPWRTKKMALENEVHNQLLAIEKEQGWLLLFDGRSLEGWHLYNKPDSTALSAWQVTNGLLYCNATNQNKVHGDLVTDIEYEDYELTFEWKIAARGNSGVFINVQEKQEIANTYQSGPEYQLLGSEHMDYGVPNKRPGSLYGFLPQQNVVEVNPSGEWNSSRILQNKGKIQFYLNGELTAEEDFNSPSWKSRVNTSGFGKQPEFGMNTKGKIALQHWYFEVWFRNMKIREL